MDINIDIFKLSNVIVDRAKYGGIGVTHSKLEPVIKQLATMYPLWKFQAEGASFDNRVATKFKVSQDGEHLGMIGIAHTRQGATVYVENNRISFARARATDYKTKDAAKAVAMVKKMFGKLSQAERLADAQKIAERTLTTGNYSKQRERNELDRNLRDEAARFVMGEGFPLFVDYVQTKLPAGERNKILADCHKLDEVKLEMLTIERVYQEYSASKTALVVKDSGKYLVKIGDEINLYDDNTLPESMRMKLGMLKLVESEQYVSNMGCRVNDEVFVLLVDET